MLVKYYIFRINVPCTASRTRISSKQFRKDGSKPVLCARFSFYCFWSVKIAYKSSSFEFKGTRTKEVFFAHTQMGKFDKLLKMTRLSL